MTKSFTVTVNDKTHTVDADPDMPLLYALRDDLGLKNPISAADSRNAAPAPCTWTASRRAPARCRSLPSAAEDHDLAGLGTPEKPHPLQTAYIEEQVPQCGYCINGWIMTAAAFLADKNRNRARPRSRRRCPASNAAAAPTVSILKAVKRAAEMMG